MPDLNVDPDTGEVIVTPEEIDEINKILDDAPEPETMRIFRSRRTTR